jgi:hypothetical protein
MTDKELIDRARAIGAELRAASGDRDRLAGWLFKEMADRLEGHVAALDKLIRAAMQTTEDDVPRA